MSWSIRVIDFRAVGWLLKEPFFLKLALLAKTKSTTFHVVFF